MEELLATVTSTEVRNYMREAMNCYAAGAYRGSIVLSYIALFDDLLAKLEELGNVNSSAKTIATEAKKRKADQEVFESYLIDQLASKGLVSELDADFLNTLRTLRNKSAHPSGHVPSAEEARFIFYETIAKFLSREILSTTQLVDAIVGRLSNANFFPTKITSDIKSVVEEETASLDEAAIPQLVAKLVAAVGSADGTVVKNANFFLIGLALLNVAGTTKTIQSKLISAKVDDARYRVVILQVVAANGSLIKGLTVGSIGRLRALLSMQIEELTAAMSETKLAHPITSLSSIAEAMPEADFVSTFEPELRKLFDKRPYSQILLKQLGKYPGVFALYFPVILSKAASNDFATANSFASAVESLDADLAALATDEQAFQLIIAVLRAADRNAFDSLALRNSRFAAIPVLRAKALSHLTAHASAAGSYVASNLPAATSAAHDVTPYLVEPPAE
jgi:hypothetical protein